MQACKGVQHCGSSSQLIYKPGIKHACLSVTVRASSDPQQVGPQAQKLFQQHKVLLGAGFSYDQAAMILSVSQQRKGAPPQLASAEPAAVEAELSSTPQSAGAVPPQGQPTPRAPADSSTTTAAVQPALKTLEDRIAFLELELLKQSLSTPLPAMTDPILTSSSSSAGVAGGRLSGSNSSFGSTVGALNPAGAGASGLSAAAAAVANRWNADGVLYRPPAPAYTRSSTPAPYATPELDAISVSTQLAAAAELGQLDPEVYALADALAVRQGFAAQPAEPQPHPVNPYAIPPQQQRQYRRPNSVWGRSAHYSRPLSANAWGDQLYQEPGYGEPLLKPHDYEEEVPYNPSGWAVAGTIMVVYLGVIVTFLAMCVGDVPY